MKVSLCFGRFGMRCNYTSNPHQQRSAANRVGAVYHSDSVVIACDGEAVVMHGQRKMELLPSDRPAMVVRPRTGTPT